MSRPFPRGVTGSSVFGTLGFFFGAGSATTEPGVAGAEPSADGVVGTDGGDGTGNPRFCPCPLPCTGGDLIDPRMYAQSVKQKSPSDNKLRHVFTSNGPCESFIRVETHQSGDVCGIALIQAHPVCVHLGASAWLMEHDMTCACPCLFGVDAPSGSYNILIAKHACDMTFMTCAPQKNTRVYSGSMPLRVLQSKKRVD